MKKWFKTSGLIAVLLAVIVLGWPAIRAIADNYVVVTSGGTQVTFKSKTTGGVDVPYHAQSDSVGNLLYQTDGSANQLVVCNQEAKYDTNTNGKTELVALSSGKKIYVCGFSFFSGGTVSVDLTQGTGTNCATGTNTKMSPTYALTVTTGIVDPAVFGASTGSNVSVVSQALCIETNAGVAVQARVKYAQY